MGIQPSQSFVVVIVVFGTLKAPGILGPKKLDRPRIWREPLAGSQCLDYEKSGIRKTSGGVGKYPVLSIDTFVVLEEKLDAALIPKSEGSPGLYWLLLKKPGWKSAVGYINEG